MKRIILLGIAVSTTLLSFGQQIGNSGFETWETVGDGEEPTNWNSFETAQGTWNSFGGVQVGQSTDIRPGSSGTKSARLYSKSVVGTLANGNLTVGIINMGSTTPSSSSNYNVSKTADANFSEAFTSHPDSLVFWVKFTPASGNFTDSARVKATIHDNHDYRDPEDATAANYVVARAVKNYVNTAGQWVRMSIPFVYNGPTSNAQFVLITFTTNKGPGQGTANDQVWVDDVQMIYNPASNQPMTCTNDSYSVDQDASVACDVLVNDVDPEGNINNASLYVSTDPLHGTCVVNNTTGVITYTPTSGYSGSDSFIYNVCDGGAPASCPFGTVSINVNFVGLEENTMANLQVKAYGNNLVFGNDKLEGTYEVYNLTGESIQKGKLASQVAFNEKSGVYLVTVETTSGTVTKRIYKN